MMRLWHSLFALALVASTAAADDGSTIVWFELGDRLVVDVGPSGELTASLMVNLGGKVNVTLDFLPAEQGGSAVGGVLAEAGPDILLPPAAFPFDAKHSTTKTIRRTFTTPSGGDYLLTFEYKAAPGTYVIQTGVKLPKKLDGEKSKKLKPKGQPLVAEHTFDALAGSALDLRLNGKKGFDGPLDWTLFDAQGAVVASGTGDGGTPGEPDVEVFGIPLDLGGEYRLAVGGFGKKKERVKLTRTLHPWASGDDIDVCP